MHSYAYTDVLGNPITVGDIVAYGSDYGIEIFQVIKLNHSVSNDGYLHHYSISLKYLRKYMGQEIQKYKNSRTVVIKNFKYSILVMPFDSEASIENDDTH